ncbi:hypothetical protein L596_022032 [Steinernema carpocapsae]|uniref:Cytochrome P450 n=1 Tax=Steinernema carpocapsae TaxID=34508 RepID=A0A4U5MKH7_STECR|nr:hypothetical protein L596_022032 [Steinernema carpocapsae]
MILLLVLLGVAAYAAYSFSKHRIEYWERHGVVGPKPTIFFGNFREIFNKTAGRNSVLQIYDWTKQFGKVYGFQEGWKNVLVISDLDMLYEIFVKKFESFHARKLYPLSPDSDTSADIDLFHAHGGKWKRIRTLSTPTFATINLKNVMPTVVHSIDVMLEFMDKKAQTGEDFNIHEHFQEFSLDGISRIALGQKGTRQFNNPNLNKIREVFRGAPNTFLHTASATVPYFQPVFRTLLFSLFRYGIIRNPFGELMDQLNKAVKLRKEAHARGEKEEIDEFGVKRVDFIDFFLEVESDEQLDVTKFKMSGMRVIKKLALSEIGCNCLLFLLAGFDTTANTLGFTAYCLAKSPETQARLREEIEEVVGSDELSYEHLGKLRFMENVVKEALRLYPVASFANSRNCTETTTVGDMTIEKGTFVQADTFAIHRNKKLWGEDADEFIPDRWTVERSHQAAWLSFGIGPRMCVGMRLANMISKLVLVKVLSKFELIASPRIDEEFGMIGGSVLMPKAVLVQLKAR